MRSSGGGLKVSMVALQEQRYLSETDLELRRQAPVHDQRAYLMSQDQLCALEVQECELWTMEDCNFATFRYQPRARQRKRVDARSGLRGLASFLRLFLRT